MTYIDLQIYLTLCQLNNIKPTWEGLRAYHARLRRARREGLR